MNPYSIELARTLAQFRGVVLLTPSSAREGLEAELDGVTIRRVLPSNLPSTRGRQGVRLVCGVLLLAVYGSRRHTLIVSWTRTLLEDLFLLILARAGTTVVVVQHNFDFRAPVHFMRRFIRRRLLANATAVATHSRSLAERLSIEHGRKILVCHHPLYVWWTRRYGIHHEAAGERRAVFIGALRADKGLEELVAILKLVQAAGEGPVILRFTGPGALSTRTRAALEECGVVVEEPGHAGFVSDEEMARAILASRCCIAPYVDVSQSASVTLAISLGIPVIAYDTGGLSELVRDADLVPLFDRMTFAAKLGARLDGYGASSSLIMSPEEWEARTTSSWRSVVEGVNSA